MKRLALPLLSRWPAECQSLGSNTGSLPELVDADSGVLVGAFDVHAWHDAMDIMIRDAAKRQVMGDPARLRVEQHFSNKQHVKRLIEYYAAPA